MKKWILLGVSLTLIFGFIYSKVWIDVTFEPETFVENGSNLDNPERGWTYNIGFRIRDDEKANENIKLINHIPSMMPQYLININWYRYGPISEYGLQQIETIFQTLRENHEKAVIRFVYDWNGRAKETEPVSFEILLKHVDQIAPICNEYSDVIYVLQGLLVGNHGEMHTSNYISKEYFAEIFEHLKPALKNNYLSVRTPAFWRQLSQTRQLENFNSIYARLGLFNDGLMASGSDVGTYGDTPYEQWKNYGDKMIKEDEVIFQSTLCNFVPNGGECCLSPDYVYTDDAIDYLKDIHVSYLFVIPTISEEWKNSEYHGVNKYQYVTDYLGYRFTIDSCEFNFNMGWENLANISLHIKNTGFANMYYDKESLIVLKNVETKEMIQLKTEDSVAYKKDISLNFNFNPYEMEKGNYEVYFKMQDKELGRMIYLANEDLYDSNMNCYLLGNIEIK